jgi:hypothetical protein
VSKRPDPKAGRSDRKWRPTSGFTTVRDFISYAVGIGVIVHEVWFVPEIEMDALMLGIALTGLPLVLGMDERKGPRR